MSIRQKRARKAKRKLSPSLPALILTDPTKPKRNKKGLGISGNPMTVTVMTQGRSHFFDPAAEFGKQILQAIERQVRNGPVRQVSERFGEVANLPNYMMNLRSKAAILIKKYRLVNHFLSTKYSCLAWRELTEKEIFAVFRTVARLQGRENAGEFEKIMAAGGPGERSALGVVGDGAGCDAAEPVGAADEVPGSDADDSIESEPEDSCL